MKPRRASRGQSSCLTLQCLFLGPLSCFIKMCVLLGCREEGNPSIQSTLPQSLPPGCLHSICPSCSFCHKPLPRSVSLEQATWLSSHYPLPPTDELNLLAAVVPHSIRLSLPLPRMYGNLSPRSFSWLCGHVSHLNPNLHVIPKDMTPFTVLPLLLVFFHFRTALPASSLTVPW